MDIDKLNELIDLMEARSLATLELANQDTKVKIGRALASSAVVHAPPASEPASKPAPRGRLETAPMVGVFYAAPSPNDPPFVRVGQTVAAGDTLGIIEAMKIMNPLEATQSGTIAEILVKNGDVVQYGQPVIRYQD